MPQFGHVRGVGHGHTLILIPIPGGDLVLLPEPLGDLVFFAGVMGLVIIQILRTRRDELQP
jgi:hypothetical protein